MIFASRDLNYAYILWVNNFKLREGSFPALLLTHAGGAATVTGDFLINIRHISEYSDPDASFLPELWSL